MVAMKWDVDAVLDSINGSAVSRCTTDLRFMESQGLKPTRAEREEGHVRLWAIGIGETWQAKVFVYGRTIRQAALRARKVVKKMTPEEQADLRIGVKKDLFSARVARVAHHPDSNTVEFVVEVEGGR